MTAPRSGPILALTFLLLAGELRAGPPANQPVPALQDVRIDQKLDTAIPLDLSFRDETGRAVKLGDYFGKKPVLLSLVYYECPMLCTLVLNGELRALRALAFDVGDEFEVVTVSFDPRETPALAAAKKAEYLKKYDRPHAAAGWHFLTGDEPAIRQLAAAVGFRYVYDPAQQQFAHSAGLMVATPAGRLSRYFYGIEYSPRDLRLGLVEAAAGRIGSLADQVTLFCYHYDPTTGRYGLAIMNIMRAAGLLTVTLVAGFVIVNLRRERRSALAT